MLKLKRDLVVHTIGRDYKANMSMKQAEKLLCENGFLDVIQVLLLI